MKLCLETTLLLLRFVFIWVTNVFSKVCEGLLHELLEVGISTWPGYMDTTLSSMDKLHTK